MTRHDWAELLFTTIGGGLLGWGLYKVREMWANRRPVVWSYQEQRWRSASDVVQQRSHHTRRSSEMEGGRRIR